MAEIKDTTNELVTKGTYSVNTLTLMLAQEFVSSKYFEYSEVDPDVQSSYESVLMKRTETNEKIPASMEWVDYVETIELVLSKTVLMDSNPDNDNTPMFVIKTNIPYTNDIQFMVEESWSESVPNMMNIVKTRYMDNIVNNYKELMSKLEINLAYYDNITSYVNSNKYYKMVNKSAFTMTFEHVDTGIKIEFIRIVTSRDMMQTQIEKNEMKMLVMYDQLGKYTCKQLLDKIMKNVYYINTL